MTTYIATSTALVGTIASALNTGFFNLVLTVLPYAIGIMVFFIGVRWAYRHMSGH